MRTFITRIHTTFNNRIVAGTAFCESCSEVCTRSCRRRAQLDRYRQAAYDQQRIHF